MNPQGTSFIPQRPTQGNLKKRNVRKVYILTYISFILFFATILGTAGTYVYKTVANNRLDAEKKLLTDERSKFDESDMESVRELNRRIENAKNRIDNHISVVSIFTALEESTLQKLRFTGFEYKRVQESIPTITLSGVTDTFNSVLFQRTVLATNKILASATFSKVELTSTKESKGITAEKTISFTISGDIDPSLIKFSPTVSTFETTETNTTAAPIGSNGVAVDGLGEGAQTPVDTPQQ